MKTKPLITIYVDTLCPFSNNLRTDLARAKIEANIRVVDRDEDAAVEMFNLTQKIHTPVIKITKNGHDTVMIGYTPAHKKKIEELLQVKL